MKEQGIKAVLTQAAYLRANICVAIDKSLQTHFHNLPIASAPPHELENGEEDDEFTALPISSVTAASAASEARSLASIRDVLEVLEEQLECLQFLSDQQRDEKNATLAELEESRGILIRRLKQHPGGQELPVIKEALSFAGEPREEYHPQFRRSYTFPQRSSETDRTPKIEEEEDLCDEDASIGIDARINTGHKERKTSSFSDNKSRPSCGLLKDLKSRFLTFLNRRLAKVSGKCVFAIAGAAAMLTLSNATYGSNMGRRKLGSSNGRERGRACPKNWAAVYSGGQRCVLVEPFREES